MASLLNVRQKSTNKNKSNLSNLTENLVSLLNTQARKLKTQIAYRFLGDGEFESDLISYEELDNKARAIASHLQKLKARPGDRALLLYPSGIEFIAAFFGCLYAQVIAVPTSIPRRREKTSRLESIVRDCEPRFILSTEAYLTNLKPRILPEERIDNISWVASDSIELNLACEWRKAEIDSDTIAFLQYTSGSTGTPKGVVVSHQNVIYNQKMIEASFSHTKETIFVGWLPLFHDMGLIGNVLQPLYLGIPCILMPPSAFLVKPILWLRAIDKYRATTSGGPNFAYELISKIPSEQLTGLDLSSWDLAFCGAEPIRAKTIQKLDVLKPYGYDPKSFYPCYGMAETTLLATGIVKQSSPNILDLKVNFLTENKAVLAENDRNSHKLNSVEIVGCGKTWLDQEIVIVDPASSKPCLEREIGEICVSGDNVTKGYWSDSQQNSHSSDIYLAKNSSKPFFKTGDLGFFHDRELFVTGRLKDLIILRGCNYYPQDIETTVEHSHSSLRENSVAVFSVTLEGKEKLIAVSEIERTARRNLNCEEIARAVRSEVSREHNLAIDQFCPIRTGSIPKTSSGKIKRQACKQKFLDNTLSVIN